MGKTKKTFKTDFNLNEATNELIKSKIIKSAFKKHVEANQIEITNKDDLQKIVKEFLRLNIEVK